MMSVCHSVDGRNVRLPKSTRWHFILTFYLIVNRRNYITETKKAKNKITQHKMIMIFQKISFLILLGRLLPIINAHQAVPIAFVSHHRITRRDRLASISQALPRDFTFGIVNHGSTKTNSVLLEPPPKNASVRAKGPPATVWSADNIQACSKLWELSPEETTTLKKLQVQLADIGDSKNNPFDVVRFLKEYTNNVELVETKFRAMVDWRRNKHVDALLEEYHPPSLYRYFPAGVLKGVDRDGDPIHLERTGAADSIGLLNRYGREEMIQQAIWLREVQSQGRWQEDYEQRHGHPVRQFTVILDMKGLSTRQIGPSLLSVGIEVGKIVQDYYPGFSKRIIIVRAPAIFQIAFKAFKPFMEEGMRKRITIISGNKIDGALEKYLDLELLPAELYSGGRGKAVDEFDTVWTGGKIPTHEEAPRSAIFLSEDSPIQVVDKPQISVSQAETMSKRKTEPLETRSWVQRQLQRLRATFWSFEDDECGWGHPYAM